MALTLPRRRWIGLGLLAGLLLLALWLLLSASGLRLLLAQVPGLTQQGVAGRLIGPITASQLRWEDGEGLVVEIGDLRLDHSPLALLTGTLRLSTLQLGRVVVRLPAPAEDAPEPPPPPALAEWRLQLPELALPLDIEVQSLTLTELLLVDARGEALLQTRVDSEALSIVDGRLRVESLRLQAPQHGALALLADVDSAAGWAGESRLDFDLQQAHGLAGSVELSGSLAQARLRLQSSGWLDGQLELELRDLQSRPGWSFSLDARVEPADADANAEASAGALGLRLTGEGEQASGRLQGELLQYGAAVDGAASSAQRWIIEQWPLRIDDPLQLRIDAARVRADGALLAQLALDGHWPLHPSAPDGALQLDWRDLVLQQQEAGAALRSTAGQLSLSGRSEDYALRLEAPLKRDEQDFELRLSAEGDSQRLSKLEAALVSAIGQADLQGSLQFAPLAAELSIDARALQPQLLLPDWPGRIELQAQASVAEVAGQLSAALEIRRLSGELKTAALAGSGRLDWVDGQWPLGQLALDWGDNALAFRRAADAEARLDLTLTQPQLLSADLSGRIETELLLPPRLQDWMGVHGQGRAQGLAYAGYALDRLDFVREPGTDAALRLQAQGLRSPQQQLDTLDLQVRPTAQGASLQLDASAPGLALSAEAGGEQVDSLWQGRIERLQLDLAPWPSLQLQAPAQWQLDAAAASLQQACVGIEQGRLCASASAPVDSAAQQPSLLQLELAQLDLGLLQAVLEDSGVALQGQLDGELALRHQAAALALEGQLRVPELLLTLPTTLDEAPLQRRAALQLDLLPPEDDLPQRARLALDLAEAGRLTLLAAGDPLAADMAVDVDVRSDGLQLALLDGLSPELVTPSGQLTADLRLAHRGGHWAGEGRLQLLAAAAELPALGIRLSEGEVTLQATPAGVLQLAGSIRSGPGRLQLSGELPLDATADARLELSGENFEAARLPIVQLQVSPQLRLSRSNGELRVRGDLTVPEALIDLARFEPGVQASRDVVVVDDPPDDAEAALPLRADIGVRMGERVRLRGFGLDGRLSGLLNVRERPGRPTTGRGELNVTGGFRAYGQNLTIKRGKLLFSGGPLGSPGLDLLAIREVSGVEAGVRVRGLADRPELSVYSDPPMDQAEAFSYLVLGRPLNAASGDESQQLGAAAAALGSVGGGLIASRLGGGSGLAIEVESSADLGGAALTVGRYLTPEIYFGVGQSLFEQIQVAILRYRLTSTLELEALSGREFKGGLNYRMER